MSPTMSLGYSPCPNDTFIFFGLAAGHVSTAPHELTITMADVEELNNLARRGVLDTTKVSMSAVPHLLEQYWLLRSGGALGRGCGPLVIARERTTMDELREATMAIPGRLTTAHLLLGLEGTHRGLRLPMTFDRIMPAVAAGEVDAGVIIHEGRFTFGRYGLEMVLDLGAWWEERFGLPLPLGGILMRRELGRDAAHFMEEAIRQSLLLARTKPDLASPYIRAHAQEMAHDVVQRHIDTFVNDYSLNVGPEGERAIRTLIEAACDLEGRPLPDTPLFWDEEE